MRSWMGVALAMVVGWTVGCAEPTEDSTPPSGGDPSNTGDPSGGDPVGGDLDDHRPPECTVGSWIEEVEGRVEDEAGGALPGAKALLCVHLALTDELKCIAPATVDSNGYFVIAIPEDAGCIDQATMRVLLPNSDRATAYCEIDLPLDFYRVTVASPFILHETTRVPSLPALGDTGTERTVIFADGLELDVTPSKFFGAGDGYNDLASRRLASDTEGLCFVDDASSLEAVYAFSPEGDIVSSAFPLRIPNSTSLEANAEVTLYLLGGLGCTLEDGTHVPEGQWVEFGTATVSGDGSTIEGDPLPCLNWFGYGP